MKKKFFIFLSTLLGLVCSYFYFSFYLNKDFTENGSAFDPVEGVSYSQNSFVWLIGAIVFFMPLLVFLFKKFLVKK